MKPTTDLPTIQPAPLPGGGPRLEGQLLRAAELIETQKRFIVASHCGPDGDALGSTLAVCNLLWEAGKEAVPFNRDGVPYMFRYLPGAERVVSDLTALPADPPVFILLDCSELDRVCPKLTLDRLRTTVLCIDHHQTFDTSVAQVPVHDEQASATAEIVYRLVGVLGTGLTREVAECLFAGIHTDTGSFRYSNTSAASLLAASEMVRAGVDVWRASSELYENHPEGRLRLLARVLRTLTLSKCGRFAFLTVSRDMYRETASGPEMLDGFINYARGIAGVEVAVQIRETDDNRHRVSFRSRGTFNVAAIAGRFGGGGHVNAAACTLSGTPREIVDRLIRTLGDAANA